MPPPPPTIYPETIKFLEVIEEIKETNRLLKVEPKTDIAISNIIYPSDRTIFSKLKNGMRKRIPMDALMNLALHFKIDMNYIFYDGFEINYYPEVLQDSATNNQVILNVSDDHLRIINKNNYNALGLTMKLYEQMMTLLEQNRKLSENKKVKSQ
ncbi:hypothetical protein [uncultured Dokdonia sp.]|uniref:hypothetical protein n=1 Tax=uncultured Dokdonia sp. TaxID=575653 RepID=UPI00260273CC|nr:hypothetical protein [uncultured Dokdonia sp.]